MNTDLQGVFAAKTNKYISTCVIYTSRQTWVEALMDIVCTHLLMPTRTNIEGFILDNVSAVVVLKLLAM